MTNDPHVPEECMTCDDYDDCTSDPASCWWERYWERLDAERDRLEDR